MPAAGAGGVVADAPADRSGRARTMMWSFHLALPLAGLWLLVGVPAADVVIEHHPTHFWLVVAVAVVNVGLAVLVDRAATRHGDARLLLVGLAFLAAAAFFGLHALATPGVLLSGSNSGFVLATPVGLALAAVLMAVSSVDLGEQRAAAVLRAGPGLRITLFALAGGWGAVSLAGLPPLAAAEGSRTVLVVLAVVTVPLFGLAAIRYFLLYRRRRAVVLLSILTADALLTESMVAVAIGVSWHLSWWLWHGLMAAAFGYVAYSAYVTYRREGAAHGLFDAVGTEQTLLAVRAEYESALETLVAAVQRRAAGELSDAEMTLITTGLAGRFGLSEGQTAVLGQAAAALRDEREQIGRLGVLVAIGHESRVRLPEEELLGRAVRRVADGFGGDSVRIGLLSDGAWEFPARLSTDAAWDVDASVAARVEQDSGVLGVIELGDGLLACRLPVKERTAGILLARRVGGFSERDRSLFASLASQLAMGLENARLYGQLDGLFHQYMSPDVATALLADPRQAALGGAVVEVTALFADLRGFTGFSERSSPEELVTMLNRYFEVATAAVLGQGGTVVQFVGDALMALFNAPARQPDHAERAVRAALDMQSRYENTAEAEWPRFRVGINTGPALVGNIGSTAVRSFNAMGDAVNVASRLESVAQPGQVVIGESTRLRLPEGAVLDPLGTLTLKGRQEPVLAFLLHDLAPRSATTPG